MVLAGHVPGEAVIAPGSQGLMERMFDAGEQLGTSPKQGSCFYC